MNKKIKEEQKRDHALYFIEEGEPGFNPDHNKAVIERTIRKTDALRKKKLKQYIDALGERSDAVATYLKSRTAEGNSPIERYFGKKLMSRLRGEKILEVLKGNYSLGGRKRKAYLTGN
jgi:hypothetical protein